MMSRISFVVLLLLVSQVGFAEIYTSALECYSSGNIRLHLYNDESYCCGRVYMTAPWTQPETKANTDWREMRPPNPPLNINTYFEEGVLKIYIGDDAFTLDLKNLNGTNRCQVLTGTMKRGRDVLYQMPTYLGQETVTCAVRVRSEDEDRLSRRNKEVPEPPCALAGSYKTVKVDEANTPLDQIPIGSKLITSGVHSDYVAEVYDGGGNEWSKEHNIEENILNSSFDLKAFGYMDGRSQYVNDSDRFIRQTGCVVELPTPVKWNDVGLLKVSTIKDISHGGLVLDNDAFMVCAHYAVDSEESGYNHFPVPTHRSNGESFTIKDFRRVLAKNKIQLQLAPVPRNLPVQKTSDED